MFPALLAASWLLWATGGAEAAALPQGVVIADDKGLSVAHDGAYFLDAQKLRPGEVIVKTLTIRNENKDTPFRLSMLAKPGKSTGRYDLLDKVRLELVMDGKTLYAGRARGDEGADMTKNALALGTWQYGDKKDLTIRLTVGKDIAIGWEKSEATFSWEFIAVRDPAAATKNPGQAKGADAGAPKTGDAAALWSWAASSCLAFAGAVMVCLRWRRELAGGCKPPLHMKRAG
ncbi:MAG: hypothetical protein LBR00_04300 [Clostridiales Family XIII bacterium]|nr:hypothetical protein [Clostridiales Family XIII bacterium]